MKGPGSSKSRQVELFYSNEFGNNITVFDNLFRSEFYFDPPKDP
jgi:hypothetical protein